MSENYTLKPAPILKPGKVLRENIFYSAISKGEYIDIEKWFWFSNRSTYLNYQDYQLKNT